MLVNVTQRHVAQRFVEHVLSIATRVNHVGSIDAVANLVTQLLSQRLNCLKGGGFCALELHCRVSESLLAQRIKHFANVLPPLRE